MDSIEGLTLSFAQIVPLALNLSVKASWPMKPIRWPLLRLQLAVCLICTLVLAALDDEIVTLEGLGHYRYMPAWGLFVFLFLPVTTVLIMAYAAYREWREHSIGSAHSAGRLYGWRVLLAQLALCVVLFIGLAFLDDEVHAFGDLLLLENLPAMTLYTFFFFLFTLPVGLVIAHYLETKAEPAP